MPDSRNLPSTSTPPNSALTRRTVLGASAGLIAGSALGGVAAAQEAAPATPGAAQALQDVTLLPEEDDQINPLGIKGLGELGNVGTAAAVVNAVYHATGRRIRDLPIRIEKLLA